jgi:molecular chaperone HtpG
MNLPPKLEELLKKDSALYGAVLLSFSELEPWIQSSGIPFFPEYTEHGVNHITDVLQTASSLVRDEAWSVVTPKDAGMLCVSTLLHDCAMHLTEDGFLALVHDGSWPIRLPGEMPWHELWAEFLSEASRFDGRKLMALFGSNEPIHRPDPSPSNWQKRDRLLIGEFLRRHHARLAQEIALAGVPGPTDDRLRLQNISPDLANLAGLIARSHGLPLRACLKRLDANDPREYKGVHAVFLMALLRVADYVQMQAERAPQQLLQVRKLQSPISEGEWQAHHAVQDIRHTHSDPEALFVQATPANAKTYLKLKRLLQDLQLELDHCWAVIGEVYGRYGQLSNLGLTIRRVRSNLDEEEVFASSVSYIPCDARFDAAGADLLKLLIHPLYGDTPEIGIRELMQNGVDACLELKDYFEQNPALQPADLTDQDADVLITLEEVSKDERYLIVSDRGME